MKPTDQLKEEHKAIKLMLDILEKIYRKLEAGEEINKEDLDKILEFTSVFISKCHHGKEEDLLFPAMEEAGVPRKGGPIEVMIEEHDIGRECVKALNGAIKKNKTNDTEAIDEIIKNARNYVGLLRTHIDKEDNILYSMADAHLSREKQDKLLKEFEIVENEKIGIGKHEEFHKLLHHLKDVYLK